MKAILSGLNGRKGVSSIATAGTALALVMISNQAAQAACAVAGSTVTCTSATLNQTPPNGFGDGTQTGVLVFVQTGSSVTGGAGGSGILIKDGQVNLADISATVQGTVSGIVGSGAGGLVVDNSHSGSIVGGTGWGINGSGTTIVIDSGTIMGGTSGAINLGGVGSVLHLAAGYSITGNVVGNGTAQLNLFGNSAASFDLSKFGAGNQYQGFNILGINGSGAWTLTGTSTVGFGIVVQPGSTAIVNGDAHTMGGTITGTLGGTGTIGSTNIFGGVLAPGNGSIGTFTVQGNLGLDAATTYKIKLSPTTADRTNISGTATLGGATVNANFGPGSYVAKQYTILNAGVLSGTFNPTVVSNMSSSIGSTLSYDAHNVFLNTTLLFGIPGGIKGNQQAVGNALTNFFNANGGIPAVFASLTPAGLTQASGEGATGSQQTGFSAMNQFMGVMTDPFLAGRGGSVSAGGASSYAEQDGARGAYASMPMKAAQLYDARWSVWAAGFGGSQTTDGNAAQGSSTATSRIFGTAVGADYRFSPSTVAGFALTGGGTNFAVANGLGGGRSDLFQAGAFVRHDNGPAYVSAALAYGWQGVTTDRTVTIAGTDSLHANFNANTWSGRLEGGYRYVVSSFGGLGLTPYAAAQVTAFDLPAYAERAIAGASTFALAYGSRTVTDSRSELGLRTDKSYAVSNGIMTLRGRAAWAHDFNTDRGVAATFQTLPGASFVVNGAVQAHDSALTTASAEMKWLNGWSTAATFEGEFSQVTRSYAGKGVVRYEW
jgi:uncharacterized protein with beta-barrel porin domain